MICDEYYDLYLAAQENPKAPYYIVSFDVIDSQSLTADEVMLMNGNIKTIVKEVYDKLLEYEKVLGKQVLIKDEKFRRPWDIEGIDNANYIDPWYLGDCFQFTVLRDTVTKEQIVELVNACKERLNMPEEFHIADGYYETNDLRKWKTKLFRGYCMQILESMHKGETMEALRKKARK